MRYAIIQNGVVVNVVEAVEAPANGVATLVANPGAIYAAGQFTNAPEPKSALTRFEFMARFTPTELAGIYAAAATDVEVLVWTKLLEAATTIELDHPQTLAGIAALVAAELLTQERADAILA